MRLRVKKGIAILAVALAAYLVLWVYPPLPLLVWRIDAQERAQKAWVASETTRWWRCRGIPRPRLQELSTPWLLRYTWADGGFGAGDVELTLTSDGKANVASLENSGALAVTRHNVSVQLVSAIAKAVDESGLLCQAPVPRSNYVADLGRYTIEVQTASTNSRVFIDECYTLPDAYAFGEAVTQIHNVSTVTRDALLRGPHATSTVYGRGACSSSELTTRWTGQPSALERARHAQKK